MERLRDLPGWRREGYPRSLLRQRLLFDGSGAALGYLECGAFRLALLVLVFAVGVDQASAATFVAGCSGTTGDVASLVNAIDTANVHAGPDTVQLAQGCVYALTGIDDYWYGPNGLPPIASDITIEGNGATIERQSPAKFRLFFVGADPTNANTDNYASPGAGVLTLRDVTLTGGFAKGGDSNGGGGGAGLGGAIFSQGTLLIESSTLAGNTAQGGSAVNASLEGGGGGIGANENGGSGGGFGPPGTYGGGAGGGGGGLNSGGGGGAGFRNSENGVAGSIGGPGSGGGPATGLGNSGGFGAAGGDGSGGGGGGVSGAFGSAGGRFGQGGGASAGAGGGGGVGGGGGGSAAVSGMGNGGAGGFGGGGGRGGTNPGQGGGGGGFGGGGGGGRAGAGGGFGGGSAPAGTSDLGGGGAGMGGAIFNMEGSLTIRDSTLTSNTALGGADDPSLTVHGQGIGGAVFNLSGTVTVTASTIAANTATNDGASIYNLVYDAATARAATTTLQDTIIATGSGPFDLASNKSASITQSPLASATVDVGQFDLVQDASRMHTVDPGSMLIGSPLTGDPRLGPLQANGGPAATMALGAGSPAIDQGNSFGLTVDQRGDTRPVDFSGIANTSGGDGADIGAFELQQACTDQALPSQSCRTLTVSLAGTGSGTVSGPRILCPASCSAGFGDGTSLGLTAAAAAGSTFTGWSAGTCSGTGVCVVTLRADTAVTATFTKATAPVLSDLGLTPSRFRVANHPARTTAAARRAQRRPPPTGTKISYRDTEQATARLTVERLRTGVRAGTRCIARHGTIGRRARRCTLLVVLESFQHTDTAGSNSLRFTGKIADKPLAPGTYTLLVVASNHSGVSNRLSAHFAIVH